MIKAFFLIFISSILMFASANSQEIGSTIPNDLILKTLSDEKMINVSSLKGKAIIIDCWATWCPPCIGGLKELDEWQKQFGDKLVVFAVSEEKPERLNIYLKNRPNSLKVISDTMGDVRKIFPYRSIPHTILIGPDGLVKAITSGINITQAVIAKLIKNESINLPLKKDNMSFDLETYTRDAFKSDTTLAENFIMQPAVKAVGTMSRTYPNTSFADRRMTIINGTISLLAQLFYKSNYFHVINEYNGNVAYKEQEKFCIDAWSKEKSEAKMLEYFRNQLAKNFVDMEIVVEKRKMNTTVLYKDNTASEKMQTCNEPYKSTGMNSLSFGVNCATISQLVEYLESFGICGTAVVDETGLKGTYKLGFEMEPGKAAALADALKNFGLYLKKETREIEVIVIRKK